MSSSITCATVDPHWLSYIWWCVYVHPKLLGCPPPCFPFDHCQFLLLASVRLCLFCNQVHPYRVLISFHIWVSSYIYLSQPLTSLSMVISRGIHMATNGIISFFFMAEWTWLSDYPTTKYSTVYLYHISLIRSSASGHLGCFHVLAIVNRATVNFGVHVYFWIIVFSRNMPRSRIAGSYGFF